MIKTNIVEPGTIVEFIVEGSVALDEVLDIIGSQYCSISHGVLWNFINGSNIALSTNDMTQITQLVKKCAIHNKTAYVGSKDVEFGLLRKYEAHASIQSVSPVMKVFRSRDDALRWIYEADGPRN